LEFPPAFRPQGDPWPRRQAPQRPAGVAGLVGGIARFDVGFSVDKGHNQQSMCRWGAWRCQSGDALISTQIRGFQTASIRQGNAWDPGRSGSVQTAFGNITSPRAASQDTGFRKIAAQATTPRAQTRAPWTEAQLLLGLSNRARIVPKVSGPRICFVVPRPARLQRGRRPRSAMASRGPPGRSAAYRRGESAITGSSERKVLDPLAYGQIRPTIFSAKHLQLGLLG